MSKTGRNWAMIAAVVFAGFVVLNVISYVWFPFLPWFEQRDAGEQVVRQEIDAEDALEEYRWFRQQWNDIQAQREQVENYYDQEEQFHETWGENPENWSRSAQTRHGRIHDRITGSQNKLEQMVADYNARSQDATASMFKCNLPYQVDKRFAISGPPGSSDAPDPNDQFYANASANEQPPQAANCDGLPSAVKQGAN